jgi:hypothetical protein
MIEFRQLSAEQTTATASANSSLLLLCHRSTSSDVEAHPLMNFI